MRKSYELEKRGTRQHLRDGDVLFEAGEERCGFFVVLAGAIKVVDGSGDEVQIVSVHKPRELTGDVDVLGARRAMVSAVAQGDTEVLHISTDELNHILSEQPALGETILNAFIERRELLVDSGFQALRVVGSPDSRRAFLLREFLARNQVPYTWLKVETEPQAGQLLAELGVAEEALPVVAYGDRPLLRNPSLHQLAEQVGLKSELDKSTYDLVVIGAGPAGLAAAVYGASEGLRLRGDDLHASMSIYLAGRIEAAENVQVRYHSEVRRLIGEERLEPVEIEDTETGKRETLQTPAVFSFIGAMPCTKWLPAQIETDDTGFICTGRDVTRAPDGPLERSPFPMETSQPGVFAAGDVRSGSTKRVSSAVGEEAMAIRSVHEYLAEFLAEQEA